MPTNTELSETVLRIDAYDALETEHRADVLAWLDSTVDVFRPTAPCTPSKHLVSYAVPLSPTGDAVLLIHHRRSGLWLPPGGHVEVGEHPAVAARRELCEELGIEIVDVTPDPCFVTVTPTTGPLESQHVDVSLWYPVVLDPSAVLRPDAREIVETRWWSPEQVMATDQALFDPHLGRFLAKVTEFPRQVDATIPTVNLHSRPML